MVTGETSLQSKKRTGKQRKWHWLRLGVQIVALVLFLYLLLLTQQGAAAPGKFDAFFHLDPLVGIASAIASRSWIAPMALGIIVLILAVATGRAWCSWICPMGTLLEWTPSRRPARKKLDIHPNWRQVKYFVLFTVLIGALLGSLTVMILDPITLLFRTVTSVVMPAVRIVITATESWLYQFGALQPAVDWFDNMVRGMFLVESHFYLPSIVIAVVFIAVLCLNAVRSRFWCRYLCPLGALLGLVSKVARVRYRVEGDKCISCKRCALTCPTGAIDPEDNFAANPAECITCLECVDVCPTQAISFRSQRGLPGHKRYDPSRRQFLVSLGAAAVVAGLLRFVPFVQKKDPLLVRPPGTSEDSLLDSCIRCGECMKVCPTGGLQPAFTSAGIEGLWTPVLVARLGYCDYSCNSCGQVCPTQAIQNLPLEQKQKVALGEAVIDKQRCIPWSQGIECVVCEEVCPVPRKAIELSNENVLNESGEMVSVLAPAVNEHRCIGCGLCENQCPVNGEAAIRVFSTGEQRITENGQGQGNGNRRGQQQK
jgi:MauM/NapG family ferredoxin protein